VVLVVLEAPEPDAHQRANEQVVGLRLTELMVSAGQLVEEDACEDLERERERDHSPSL